MSRTIQYVELEFKYSTILVYNKIPSNQKLKKAIVETLMNKWSKKAEEIKVKYLEEKTVKYSEDVTVTTKLFKVICGTHDFDKYTLKVKITEMPVLTA